MSFLVRKIDQGKWMQSKILEGEDVSADAITICMKTTKNNLSVWRIENEENLDEAVLAIVSAADHLDSIDVVWFEKNELDNRQIITVDAPGNTKVPDLVDTHENITNLTYVSLGIISQFIVNCFSQEKKRRYTKTMLRKILNTAIDENRLSIDNLAETVVKKL